MKTSKWLIISLIIVFSFACTLPTNGTPASPQRGESPSVPLSPASDTPTPVPPASDTPTPVTPEAGAPQGGNVPVEFNIPSQNDTAPAGILEQLSWAGQGTGPGVKWPQVCGDCDVVMENSHLTLSNFQPAQELKVLIYRSKGEVKDCAVSTAEYVTTLSIQVDEKGNFSAGLSGPTKDLHVVSVLDAITGNKIWKSHLVLYEQQNCVSSQGNQSVNLNIPLQNDPAPAGILEQLSWGVPGTKEASKQVCGECDVIIQSNRILFSGFEPSQEIKVLMYRHKGRMEGCALGSHAEYVTTLSIRVDEAGNFSAGLSGPTENLLVISVLDTRTGNRIWKSFSWPYEQRSCPSLQAVGSCTGAPPQRLKVNQMAYVCTSEDAVKLREGPGKNFSTLKMLVPGADVTIIGGPTCADNWSWWQVKTESGYTGWMSEGGDQTDPYFLCPKP